MTATNWGHTLTFPRFDPVLGTLTSIDLSFTASVAGTGAAESLDTAPLQFTMGFQANLTLTRPDNSFLTLAYPVASFVDNYGAFDGTIDFGGTSGVTHAGINVQATSQVSLASNADIALFSGPAGNPGSIALPVYAMGAATMTGPGNPVSQFLMQAGADVTICYEYVPASIPICSGDGSATACPCGNSSPVGAGQGCTNSTGAGARLDSSGAASVAHDTFVLACSGLPATSSALFFQGTSLIAGGIGFVFGDGVRCVGGSIVRLRVKVAVAGVVTYPGAGDPHVSTAGSVPANAVRHYQVWYRNVAPFCTPSSFNLSQGLSVTWVP